MFGFGLWELLLVGAVVLFALFSGRNIASATRKAGQLTGLWLKIKRKLSLLRFLK
jgi:Sec-independent protein translocase protein TatA